MDQTLLLLHVLLIVIGFLIALNFYLRGAAKAKITSGLLLLLISTIIAIWIMHGWIAGLSAVPLAYIYVALTTPLARAAAFRLLGYRTSAESGADFSDLRKLEVGSLSLDSYFEKAARRRHREEIELNRLISRPAVRAVLRETGKSDADVRELVRVLSLTGAGRELALSAVTDSALLGELLEMQGAGSSSIELAAKVMRL